MLPPSTTCGYACVACHECVCNLIVHISIHQIFYRIIDKVIMVMSMERMSLLSEQSGMLEDLKNFFQNNVTNGKVS